MRRGGFTLVGVLILMAVLSIGLLAAEQAATQPSYWRIQPSVRPRP